MADEEVVIRLKAQLENDLREIDQAKAKIDGFEASLEELQARGREALNRLLPQAREISKVFDKDAESAKRLQEAITGIASPDISVVAEGIEVIGSFLDDTSDSAEDAEESLGQVDESVRFLRDTVKRLSPELGALRGGLKDLAGVAGATAVAVVIFRQEMNALRGIGSRLSEVFPEIGEEVSQLGEDLKRFTGPISFLKGLIDDVAEGWQEWLDITAGTPAVLSGALQEAVEAGEDATAVFQLLREEILRGPAALDEQAFSLFRVAESLEATGEATDPLRVKLFQLATDLVTQYKLVGQEVPASLQRLIDRYAELGTAAEDSTDKAIAAAERASEKLAAEQERQARALEAKVKRELAATEKLAEREAKLLAKRLAAFEDFRDSLEGIAADFADLGEDFSPAGDPKEIDEAAEALGRVSGRLEELRSQSTITRAESQELAELRRQETELLGDVRQAEIDAAQAGVEGTGQVAEQQKVLSDLIGQARDRLDTFREKFGELAPAAVSSIESIIRQLELESEQVRVNADEVEALGIRLEVAFDRGTAAVEKNLGAQKELGEELASQRSDAEGLAAAAEDIGTAFEGVGEAVAGELGPAGEALGLAADEAERLALAQTETIAANERLVEIAADVVSAVELIASSQSDALPGARVYAEELTAIADALALYVEQSDLGTVSTEALFAKIEEAAVRLDVARQAFQGITDDIDRMREAMAAAETSYESMAQAAVESGARQVAALQPVLTLLEQIVREAENAASALREIGEAT